MKNNTLNNQKFQLHLNRACRDLLKSTKLSRLPERKPFILPDFDNTPTKSVVVVAVCAGCGGRLDAGDNLQQLIYGCRKCVGIYARIGSAIDEASKRKTKALLKKFAAEVK